MRPNQYMEQKTARTHIQIDQGYCIPCRFTSLEFKLPMTHSELIRVYASQKIMHRHIKFQYKNT